MIYAIVSDIHANRTAFERVLADAAAHGATAVIVLGDVVGYGPDPAGCVELVRSRAQVALMGNNDAAAAGLMDLEDFNEFAAESIQEHIRILSAADRDYLKHLPYVWATGGAGAESFACVHGDFTDPAKFNYLEDDELAALNFARRPERVLFCGHTHCPAVFAKKSSSRKIEKRHAGDFVLEEGWRYIVNVGSCGHPRGTGRCTYALFDDCNLAVRFRRVVFDVGEYSHDMRKKVDEFVERMKAGYAADLREKPPAPFPWKKALLWAAGAALAMAVPFGCLAAFHAYDVAQYEKTVVPPELRREYAVTHKESCVYFGVFVEKGSEPVDAKFWFEDARGYRLDEFHQHGIKRSWQQGKSNGGVKVPKRAVKCVLEIMPRKSGLAGVRVEGPRPGTWIERERKRRKK